MKKKGTGHPTAEILKMAMRAPGGLIRWHEARDVYVRESEAAKRDMRSTIRGPVFSNLFSNRSRCRVRTNYRFHMALKKVLDRHFEKVEGTNGYYVLLSSTDESTYNQEP